MVKRFLIAGLIVGFLSSVGYAEIKKEVDSFDGTIKITSEQKYDGILGGMDLQETPRPGGQRNIFEDAQFAKVKTSDGTEACALLLSRLEEKWCFFENAPLEMKIDKKIYYLPIYKTDSKARKKIPYYLSPNLNPGNLYTSALWIVDKTGDKMQKRILKAGSITVRVHYSNHPYSTWEVSSKILDEWKQVIREEF